MVVRRTRTGPARARGMARVCGVIGLVVTLHAAGCASPHDQMVAFLRSHEAEVSTGHYVVRPPDALTINAPGAPEVDGATQMVRADGKIVLRLLGEVDVAGLTTGEIAEKLKIQLARYYVDPEVVVQVSGYNSQFYYVFGEVSSPGPKRYTGRDTLVMALADAQPTFLAWRSQIRIVRPSVKEGGQKVITVDLGRMLQAGDQTMNILLQEGDAIEVPPTPLAWVGQRVRELMYPVSPVLEAYNSPAAAITSTRTINDGVDSSDNHERSGLLSRFAR